jgi:hypothetical protein
MFRIETFCDDKNLPRVLHALTGLVLGVPKATPVANATKKSNGAVRAETSGDVTELFSAFVAKAHLREVNAASMKEFCRAHGYADASYSHVLGRLIKAKLLRKRGTGSGSKYLVAGGK